MRVASGKAKTRIRQEMNNEEIFLFNMRKPPGAIFFLIFTASNIDAPKTYSRLQTSVKQVLTNVRMLYLFHLFFESAVVVLWLWPESQWSIVISQSSMPLQKYSGDDEDGADDGGREDGLAEYEIDHHQREEGNQVNQASDVGGCFGEFQRLEPDQEGDSHLEQTDVCHSEDAFDIQESKMARNQCKCENVNGRPGEVEKQAENVVSFVFNVINPI